MQTLEEEGATLGKGEYPREVNQSASEEKHREN